MALRLDVDPLALLAASFLAAWFLVASAALGAAPPTQVAAGAPPASSCPGSNLSPRLLAVGESLEAEIRGGERHAFRLQLPPGSFATARVERRGVDLVVEVGPEEKPSPRIVDTFQTAEPIEFSVLIEHERCVDFVVTPRLASAAATSYRLEVLTSRPAEPADTLRIRAEDVVSAAVALYREATADSLRGAIERLLEAARLYEEAGAVAERAGTLGNAAVIAYALSEPRQAIELAETAVSLQEAVANKEGAASSHLNLAVLYGTLGEIEPAQQHHLRAIALAREIGDRRGEATAINNFGVFLGQNGDRQQALVLLEQALAMRRELHDSAGDGATLASLGSFYSQLGEPQTAKEYLERALLLFREAQDVVNLATTLNLLGRVRLDLGDTKGALEAQNEALQIERRSGDRRGEAFSAQSLGEIAASLGDHAKALELFQQALDLQRALGNRRGEASALHALGSSRAARGESDEARTAYEAALPLRVAVADRGGEIVTRLALARLLRDRGDLAGAQREAAAAVDLVETLRTKVTAQELRAGYLAGFRGVYDVLVDVLMRLDEKESGRGHAAEALAIHERGRARALLEQLRENQVELREGMAPELIDRQTILRRTLASKAEAQMRLLSRKEPDTAGAAEMAREIDAIRLELDRLEARMRAESPRFAALSPAQPLSLAEIQAEVLDADTVLLEYAVSKEGSYLWVVSRDGLEAHRLPEAEKMEAKARRAYELLATPIAAKGAGANELPTLLRELSETLLRPAAAKLEGKRIAVVPTGALQLLPLAVLPDPLQPDSPLVARHEVVGLPSASVGAFLRRAHAGRPTPSQTLAVFADPVFSSDDERVGHRSRATAKTVVVANSIAPAAATPSRDSLAHALRDAGLNGLPRLPFSRREAQNIAALVPARERLEALDFDANLDTVRSPRLSDFRILHFATHGFLAASHPQYSGLVLSLVDERGQEQRGFLSAADVFNLRLAADLVVLSGCRTGLGKVVAGEGVVGLTRAFLHAGAERVVASLWPVDDAATAELMRRFYEGMLGKRRLAPAAALREAQLALRSQRRWQAPFYWAGFQVQGEWR
jgi:CHAT domain-containing protein/Tfp pilus assembly protein PilF